MDIQLSKADGILTHPFRPRRKEERHHRRHVPATGRCPEGSRDRQRGARHPLHRQATGFSAGNDLEDFLKNPPKTQDAPVFQFLWQISHASKPIVAAVRAWRWASAPRCCCIATWSMADNAKFSMPFTQLGLCPEAASSLLLPHIAGYQRAAEKLLLGEAFGADEAAQMGVVNRVLPLEELLPYAQQQAAKLAACRPRRSA
jgi:enoyl-CoA hydratase/carnithine racemase